jgi:tripartite-type tricarboxylate transporter receptor subunit TctC
MRISSGWRTMRVIKRFIPLLGSALLLFDASSAATAQTGDAFYRTATVTLLVAADAGGGYDVYARTFMPFLRRHIAGNPTIIVQNMPGNGGVRMGNYLFNDAKKDGSVIGLTLSPVILSQLMEPHQVRYDADKFAWLGTIDSQTNVLSVWAARTPVRTIDDAKKKEVTIGATNPDSFLYQEPALMNALLDTKFKIVKGYKGVNDLNLALERGEVDGQVSPWSSWKSDRPDWLSQGKLVHLIRTGAPSDDLPGVPQFAGLVSGERAKSLVGLLDMSSLLGRSIAAPPGAPAERVAILRQAFTDAVHDPEFRAEMEKRKLPVSFRSGEDLQSYVGSALRTPPSTIQEFLELITPK